MDTKKFNLRTYRAANGKRPLREWLDGLKDRVAVTKIKARLLRLEIGNFGDVKFLREGVSELRVDFGPGYRVYFSQQGHELILLLCGSDKRQQEKSIELAVSYLTDWKAREHYE